MILKQKSVFLVVFLLAILINVGSGQVFAAPILADVQDTSGSLPHLNATGDAWETFDTAQAAPAKGGLVVVYTPTDLADLIAFPIQTDAHTVVNLRPGTAKATVPCSEVAGEPMFTASNAGQCFFRVNNDRVHLYYMGQMDEGGDIRYRISELRPAAGAGIFQPFDSDNVLPDTPPSPVAGRDPARLVLVLDKSGSMAWSSHPDDEGCGVYTAPTPDCEPARWEILNRAVTQMLAIARAYSLPDDEFAVALFDNDVERSNRFDLTTLDSTSIEAFEIELSTRSPGGSTSIGAGVTAFESDLIGEGAANFNQIILLFTDGDQNTAPYLVTNSTQALINPTTDSPVGAGVREFAEGRVAICPFALRADAPADTLGTTYLQDIATQGGCNGLLNTAMNVDPSDPNLIQFFLEVLNNTLIGDKLELNAVQSGKIAQGGSEQASESFIISEDDPVFTLLLNWAEIGNGLIGLELSKDGVTFDLLPPPSAVTVVRPRVERGPDYMAVTLRKPFCNDQGDCVKGAGEWSLTLKPFFKVSNEFNYNLFTMTDNQTLASNFHASQSHKGVGSPLTLEATLTEGGLPLTGLPDGAVTAVVARPDAGLGNVLSAADVDALAGPEGDSISAAGRKAAAMLADPDLRAQLLAALDAGKLQTVTLSESDPGVYRGDFTDTVVEGAYTVNFFVDAEAPDNGRFMRTFKTMYYVSVVPDQDATTDTVATLAIDPCPYPGGCFAIDVQPKDGAGNLLGPGKASLFTLPDFKGVQLEPVADNLNGTYTIKVGYPEGVSGNPTLDIYGVQITPDVIPEPMDNYFILLLVLLLLLLVIYLVWRRRPV